ncbi:beta family protein [Corynebacterium variabile]|uniref:beta family protein n=1 Tax=Corynebacterium variabile TaxID=1727 RepID=UPI003BAFF042
MTDFEYRRGDGIDTYVPILYTKAGERRALGSLDSAKKKRLLPLFVIPPIQWDYMEEQPLKTIDEHLAKLPGQLIADWGTGTAFIDGYHVMDEVIAGLNPIEWIVDQTRTEGLPLIPAVSEVYSPAYIAGVQNLVTSQDRQQVCLRLTAEQWPGLTGGSVAAFLRRLGVDVENVHLVLDLRDDTSQAALAHVAAELQRLPHALDWRTVTVAATAIPATSPTRGSGIDVIDRQEWINYQSLLGSRAYGAREPLFGDYAISHPDLAETDPRKLQIRAKIKYTADDTWLWVKGGMYKANNGQSVGGTAIIPAVAALKARPEYTSGHCGGEQWIDAAAGVGPTGNTTTWVTVGTQHHLLRVLDQV